MYLKNPHGCVLVQQIPELGRVTRWIFSDTVTGPLLVPREWAGQHKDTLQIDSVLLETPCRIESD